MSLLISLLLALNSQASMMAQHSVPVKTALAALAKNHDEETLLQIGRDEFGLKYLRLPGQASLPGELEALSFGAIAQQLNDRLGPESWGEKADAATLKKNRALLKRAFEGPTAPPHAWPWILFELGERDEARAELERRYTAESARVMALADASTFLGHGPLTESEFLLAGLRAVCSPTELAAHEETMRKMKVHVSQLPRSEIMTGLPSPLLKG